MEYAGAVRTSGLTAVLSCAAFGFAAIPAVAGAQEPVPPPAAEPSASTPAAPSSTPSTLVGPSGPVTPEARERARLHFTAGVNLLRDPEKARYEEAYAEFKHAYALVGSPSILGNIGLCAMKLERDAEAIEAYTKYLAEMTTLDPEEKAQAERDLVTLKAGLVQVTVQAQPDGALLNDQRVPARGEAVLNIYGPLKGATTLGLRRGHHILKARFPSGRESPTWELDVNGGESHTFEEPPAPVVPDQPVSVQKTRPIPPSVYIGALGTAAFAIGTLVTGTLAVNTRSRFVSANDGTNEARASDLHSSAQTLNVVTDVLLGLTVIGAGVTTYLYLSRPTVTSATGQVGQAGQASQKTSQTDVPWWLSPVRGQF